SRHHGRGLEGVRPARERPGGSAAARDGRPLLRLSDQVARIPSALPGRVPARWRHAGRNDPSGGLAHAPLVEIMGRGTRLLSLLRPYSLLFAATIAATVISSVLDGFTFVLLIPFLRTLFGNAALPAEGGSQVEAILNTIAGPLLATGNPEVALRNVVIVL